MERNPERIAEELARLEMAERELSGQRRELHQRIDRIYLSAPLGVGSLAFLEQLDEQERALSDTRNRLHRAIDELRAKVGLPPRRQNRALGEVA